MPPELFLRTNMGSRMANDAHEKKAVRPTLGCNVPSWEGHESSPVNTPLLILYPELKSHRPDGPASPVYGIHLPLARFCICHSFLENSVSSRSAWGKPVCVDERK